MITAVTYQTRVKFRFNGKKQYELSNHLGNVLVTISDRRTAVCNESRSTLSYNAVVLTANDYYAFGSVMVGREYEADTVGTYRFGFNGKEKINEIYGDGNGVDFGARIYDGRLGRWLSIEHMYTYYLGYSPYNFTLCNPIAFKDEDGNVVRDKDGNIVYVSTGTVIDVVHPTGSTTQMEIGYIFADDGTKIQVYRNVTGSAEWKTNCHGTTFLDALYWLNNNQVPSLLKGDGYVDVEPTKLIEKDIIVFENKTTTDSERSATVTKPDAQIEEAEVEGEGGLETAKHKDKVKDAWNTRTATPKAKRKETPDKVASSIEINKMKYKAVPFPNLNTSKKGVPSSVERQQNALAPKLPMVLK